MIEITASLKGYGVDIAYAETPEDAVGAARTMADEIREGAGSSELVSCEFVVADRLVRKVWF